MVRLKFWFIKIRGRIRKLKLGTEESNFVWFFLKKNINICIKVTKFNEPNYKYNFQFIGRLCILSTLLPSATMEVHKQLKKIQTIIRI